jgi:thiamine transporter
LEDCELCQPQGKVGREYLGRVIYGRLGFKRRQVLVGPQFGVLAGVVFSFVVMLNPTDFYVVHPVQLLLDYPIAFGALGLVGFFRKHELTGVAVGIGGRFLAHFLSGLIFFAIYAPQVFLGLNIGGNAYSYSALHNGSFMLPELVISLLVITVLVRRNLIDLCK